MRPTGRLLGWLLPVGLVLAAVILAVGVSGSAARLAEHKPSNATGGGTSAVLDLHEGSAFTFALSGDDHSIVTNFMAKSVDDAGDRRYGDADLEFVTGHGLSDMVTGRENNRVSVV